VLDEYKWKRSAAATLQLACHWALSSARRYMEPVELINKLASEGVIISSVNFSRYVSGRILPSPERAREILKAAYRSDVLGEVLRRTVVVDDRGVVNTANIAFNMDILTLAASMALIKFWDYGVNKVLTAAVNGVPLASLVSLLLDAGLCVARREAESSSYVEVKYFAPEPPRYVSLFIPRGSLREGDRVLVVDDLLRSGRTLRALLELAGKKGTSVVAVFSLIAVGDEWIKVVEKTGIEVYVGHRVDFF